MTIARIAALPMYDFPDLTAAHDALWQALATRLAAAGVDSVPQALSRDLSHVDFWRHPGLLLGQACEYPLAKAGVAVRLVATPRYSAPGCDVPVIAAPSWSAARIPPPRSPTSRGAAAP